MEKIKITEMNWNKFLDKFFLSSRESQIIAIKKKYAYYFSIMNDVDYDTFLGLKKLEQEEINKLPK